MIAYFQCFSDFAIIDDIGAILMIAIFYSGGISAAYLLSSFAVFIFLLILNRMRVINLAIYLFAGFLLLPALFF